jgi:hypothetical protein
MLGAMTFARRRYRNARLATIAMVLATLVIGVSSCEGDEPKQADPRANDRAQVTENDVLQCGMTTTLFDNRTQNGYNLHVKVKNDCTAQLDDTLRPPPDDAHLKVLDAQGNVVNGQDITIPSQTTWRGAVNVPTAARLVLECGRRARYLVNNGCGWSYTYSP